MIDNEWRLFALVEPRSLTGATSEVNPIVSPALPTVSLWARRDAASGEYWVRLTRNAEPMTIGADLVEAFRETYEVDELRACYELASFYGRRLPEDAR